MLYTISGLSRTYIIRCNKYFMLEFDKAIKEKCKHLNKIVRMEMKKVSSSQISEVGYDEDSSTLVVIFTNGSIYEYENVPKNVYDSLISASSVGKYFGANIKYKYNYSKR